MSSEVSITTPIMDKVDNTSKERMKRFLKKNPDYFKLYKRKKKRVYSPLKNKEKYSINKDRINKNRRDRYKNNLEDSRFYSRIRKHQRRTAGVIDYNEWIKKCNLLGNKCQMCGKSSDVVKLTIDHILPISKGGTNILENLQPLCLNCNSKKGSKIIWVLSPI